MKKITKNVGHIIGKYKSMNERLKKYNKELEIVKSDILHSSFFCTYVGKGKSLRHGKEYPYEFSCGPYKEQTGFLITQKDNTLREIRAKEGAYYEAIKQLNRDILESIGRDNYASNKKLVEQISEATSEFERDIFELYKNRTSLEKKIKFLSNLGDKNFYEERRIDAERKCKRQEIQREYEQNIKNLEEGMMAIRKDNEIILREFKNYLINRIIDSIRTYHGQKAEAWFNGKEWPK